MTYRTRASRDREALESLGRAVRIARQRSGLTQRALEALSGVDQTAISRMERGLVPGMAVVKFARVAMVLGDHLLASDPPRRTTGASHPPASTRDYNAHVAASARADTEGPN